MASIQERKLQKVRICLCVFVSLFVAKGERK
jgi:hypothetical protein